MYPSSPQNGEFAARIGETDGTVRLHHGGKGTLQHEQDIEKAHALCLEWSTCTTKKLFLVHEPLLGVAEWKVFQSTAKGNAKLKLAVQRRHIVRCDIPEKEQCLNQESDHEVSFVLTFHTTENMLTVSKIVSAYLASCVSRKNEAQSSFEIKEKWAPSDKDHLSETFAVEKMATSFVEVLRAAQHSSLDSNFICIFISKSLTLTIWEAFAYWIVPRALSSLDIHSFWRSSIVECSYRFPLKLAHLVADHRAVKSPEREPVSMENVGIVDVKAESKPDSPKASRMHPNTSVNSPAVVVADGGIVYTPLVSVLTEPISLSTLLPAEDIQIAEDCVSILNKMHSGQCDDVHKQLFAHHIANLRKSIKAQPGTHVGVLHDFVNDLIRMSLKLCV